MHIDLSIAEKLITISPENNTTRQKKNTQAWTCVICIAKTYTFAMENYKLYFHNLSGSYMSFSLSWERHSSFRSSSLLLTSCSRGQLALNAIKRKIEAYDVITKIILEDQAYVSEVIINTETSILPTWSISQMVIEGKI